MSDAPVHHGQQPLLDAIELDTVKLLERIDQRLAQIEQALNQRSLMNKWRTARTRLAAERRIP